MNSPSSIRPPFDREKALAKVRAAENAWNTRDPLRVSLAYSENSIWRNRDQFIQGREMIVQFLTSKWARELDYRLIKECGLSRTIKLQCDSNTNGTTQTMLVPKLWQ